MALDSQNVSIRKLAHGWWAVRALLLKGKACSNPPTGISFSEVSGVAISHAKRSVKLREGSIREQHIRNPKMPQKTCYRMLNGKDAAVLNVRCYIAAEAFEGDHDRDITNRYARKRDVMVGLLASRLAYDLSEGFPFSATRQQLERYVNTVKRCTKIGNLSDAERAAIDSSPFRLNLGRVREFCTTEDGEDGVNAERDDAERDDAERDDAERAAVGSSLFDLNEVGHIRVFGTRVCDDCDEHDDWYQMPTGDDDLKAIAVIATVAYDLWHNGHADQVIRSPRHRVILLRPDRCDSRCTIQGVRLSSVMNTLPCMTVTRSLSTGRVTMCRCMATKMRQEWQACQLDRTKWKKVEDLMTDGHDPRYKTQPFHLTSFFWKVFGTAAYAFAVMIVVFWAAVTNEPCKTEAAALIMRRVFIIFAALIGVCRVLKDVYNTRTPFSQSIWGKQVYNSFCHYLHWKHLDRLPGSNPIEINDEYRAILHEYMIELYMNERSGTMFNSESLSLLTDRGTGIMKIGVNSIPAPHTMKSGVLMTDTFALVPRQDGVWTVEVVCRKAAMYQIKWDSEGEATLGTVLDKNEYVM